MTDFGVHRDRVLADFVEFEQSRSPMRRNRLRADFAGVKQARWQVAIADSWTIGQIQSSVGRLERAIAAARVFGDNAQTQLEQLRASIKSAVEFVRPKIFSDRARSKTDYAEARSEISTFLVSCRRIFWALAIFSGLSNLLMLNGSFFMLQVYDRVLPGRSIPTLVALLILASALYVFQAGLDLVRSRISVRVGRHFDERLGLRVFDAVVRLPLKTRGDGDGLQPLRDLDQVRGFLSGGGPTALFDLPWMPI